MSSACFSFISTTVKLEISTHFWFKVTALPGKCFLTAVFHTNRARIAVRGLYLLFLLMAMVFQPLYIYHLLELISSLDYVAAKWLSVLAGSKSWPDGVKTSQPGMRIECFPDLWMHLSQLPYLDLRCWQRKYKKELLAEYLSSPFVP